MPTSTLHRFEQAGRRFVVDTETCFCFECDDVSWAVLDHYPNAPVNQILHRVGQHHPVREVEEVIGELEWLRSSKSILPAAGQKEHLKQFDQATDMARIDVRVDAAIGEVIARNIAGAVTLLLGRSGSRKALLLRIRAAVPVFDLLAAPIATAFRDAALAGKALTVELEAAIGASGRDAKALQGHGLTIALPLTPDGLAAQLDAFRKALARPLAQIPAACNGATATLTPGTGTFREGVTQLRAAGFTRIDIDLPGAYSATPRPDPAALLQGMREVAVYYAEQLHAGNFFRLEPIAATFHQIYEGTPRPRSDGSGTSALAIDGRGAIYPSPYFFGQEAFRLGDIAGGLMDESRRGAFDDLGALTTSPCSRCWARNLCGGGHSAIHHALSGGIRRPDAAWCDSQREWFAAAIAAFNLLAANGVNFARLYATLGPARKPSLWQAAKAAITMKVGVRPIEEADAPLLTRWENWSGATYFLGNEYGMFLATQYDREMDSLHPRGFEQEMMIVSRRGEPIGLLKMRPDQQASVARVWIYMRDPARYGDSGLRRSFAHILAEAARSESTTTTLMAAAGPGDPGLADFLEAVGFRHAGIQRQALFLHDAYHDLQIYTLRLA